MTKLDLQNAIRDLAIEARGISKRIDGHAAECVLFNRVGLDLDRIATDLALRSDLEDN